MKSHFRVSLSYTGLIVDCDRCLVHLATVTEGTLTLAEFEAIARRHSCEPTAFAAATAMSERILAGVQAAIGAKGAPA